jgi:hypothetical protein
MVSCRIAFFFNQSSLLSVMQWTYAKHSHFFLATIYRGLVLFKTSILLPMDVGGLVGTFAISALGLFSMSDNLGISGVTE